MKAFIYERYGPPETLRMVEVDKPAPGAGEVLVKVLAASVNAADWHVLRGRPLFSRATLGLLRPKHQILGVDVAGQVEAVGSDVTGFQAGDEVDANLLDHGYGGFAEYVAVPVTVESPDKLARRLLRALAEETDEDRLRRQGRAVELLGADHVVDYTTTDVVGSGRRYDLILDTVGNRSVPELRRALAEGGKAAVTGFTSVARLLGVSLRGGKDVAQVQAHVTAEDLERLSELIEAGKLRPQIDRRYRFADIPAAIAYLEQGRARAKVVVGVA